MQQLPDFGEDRRVVLRLQAHLQDAGGRKTGRAARHQRDQLVRGYLRLLAELTV
ncbi:MAG TPA: hypothetical protein VNO70_18540 [Blastocatellia bacterium]|nr:hypothetical protein [Blastocatellia bacterium]